MRQPTEPALQKTLQDHESYIEVAQEPQAGLFKADAGHGGPVQGGALIGFQNPFPRIPAKFNYDIISE